MKSPGKIKKPPKAGQIPAPPQGLRTPSSQLYALEPEGERAFQGQDLPSRGAARGHHFGEVALNPPQSEMSSAFYRLHAGTCPLATPRTCPFGGACHTCPVAVQPKLAISQPGDIYEQEADRVAEEILRRPAEQVLQRNCSPCGRNGDEEEVLRAKEHPGHIPAVGLLTGVPPLVQEVIRSPGEPLDPQTREFMESRFGHDFSRVRVHIDRKAADSTLAVNALAYTMGRNIVFAKGSYEPNTAKGRRLIAHELAHVVQQSPLPWVKPTSRLIQPGKAAGGDAPHFAAQHSRAGNASKMNKSGLTSLQPMPPGFLSRTIAYDPDCQPQLEEVQGNVSRAQRSAARWARAAITSLATPEDIGSLLRSHFNVAANDASSVSQIRNAFETVAGLLEADAFTYHCRPDSDSRCWSRDGQMNAGFVVREPEYSNHIFFCNPYPYQDFFGHRSLIETLLHEAAHAHNASFNHDTYEWEEGYPGPNPLTNAESYMAFARDAALGRSRYGVEVAIGEFRGDQFYIAVGASGEIGGPALDIINLQLGTRLAYMPGTEAQPHRGLVAEDIGVRINPIRQRVYVDIATGAFFGINFTDMELMAGIANRLSAGYRGERFDLGLDLSQFYDFVAGENFVIVGVRSRMRF